MCSGRPGPTVWVMEIGHRTSSPGDFSRVVTGGALVAGMFATIVLCLSDRAPGLIRGAVFRFDLADEVRTVTFGVNPYMAGHFAIWASLAFVTAFALARRPAFMFPAAVALCGAGVIIEEAQRRFTSARGFEYADIAANTVGVTVGSLVALTVIGGHRLVTARRR